MGESELVTHDSSERHLPHLVIYLGLYLGSISSAGIGLAVSRNAMDWWLLDDHRDGKVTSIHFATSPPPPPSPPSPPPPPPRPPRPPPPAARGAKSGSKSGSKWGSKWGSKSGSKPGSKSGSKPGSKPGSKKMGGGNPVAQWASSAGGGKAKGKKQQAGGIYSAARDAAYTRAAKSAKPKPPQSGKGGNAAAPPGAVAAAPPSAAANTPAAAANTPERAVRLDDHDEHDASAGGAGVETAAGGSEEEPRAGDASTWLHMDESVGEEDSDETARDASRYGPRGRMARSAAREEGEDLEEGVLGNAMVTE